MSSLLEPLVTHLLRHVIHSSRKPLRWRNGGGSRERDGDRGPLTEDRKAKVSNALEKPDPHLNGQLESSADLGPVMCEVPTVCGSRWCHDHLLARDRGKFLSHGDKSSGPLLACLHSPRGQSLNLFSDLKSICMP